MFLLLARPFKIGDLVDIAGESEVRVKDITTMFTLVEMKGNVEMLILNSMIVRTKIVIRESRRINFPISSTNTLFTHKKHSPQGSFIPVMMLLIGN